MKNKKVFFIYDYVDKEVKEVIPIKYIKEEIERQKKMREHSKISMTRNIDLLNVEYASKWASRVSIHSTIINILENLIEVGEDE